MTVCNIETKWILLALWAAVNVTDGWWIYEFVRASVDPNPHTAVNRTHAGYQAFEAFMFIFGFPWGVVNIVVMWSYYALSFEKWNGARRSRWLNLLFLSFQVFVIGPVVLALAIIPFFGGWILVPIAQKWAWEHRCDSYPMYAILDGKSYKDPRYAVNVVYFYEQGNPNSLYTYEIANPGDADLWTFGLRTWDTLQSNIPLNMYPTLQNVAYDFVNTTVAGNCTVPLSSGSQNITSLSCMSGTFDPGSILSFSLTSAIPLNNTSNTTNTPSTTSLLRAVDKQWSFSDDAPSLILKEVDTSTNALQKIVLRTAVTKLSDCTELKVCLAGTGQKSATIVGAEVMAPLGLMLMRQADYALECTTPTNSD